MFSLAYELDHAHLDHLEAHLFGRRIWASDRQDWSAEQIVSAAHQQNDAEACFRDLHGEAPAAWSPMWHWTEQKIAVHAFSMVLALLRLRARRAGDQRDTAALIKDLDHVDESWLAYPAAGPSGQGRPRIVQQLNDCSPSTAATPGDHRRTLPAPTRLGTTYSGGFQNRFCRFPREGPARLRQCEWTTPAMKV